MSVSGIILIILGAVFLMGLFFVMGYALNFAKPRPEPKPQEPALPGSEGGGSYLMRVEKIETYKDRARLEDVLNALPDIHAEADFNTCEVVIRYKGFPSLDLLDVLRKTVEDAGFTVVSIE